MSRRAMGTASRNSPELIDLTDRGILRGELLARLDAVTTDKRQAFNAMMAELSLGLDRNIDWWVSRPATRNTHASVLHAKCMQLALIRILRDENRNIRVLVDDTAMAHAITSVGIPVLRVGRGRELLRRVIRPVRDIASTIFHVSMAALAARLTRTRPSGIAPDHELIVLDEFVNRDSFQNGIYRDHYFAGIDDALSPTESSRLCILPTFYRVHRYHEMVVAMRLNKRRFILREDYLRLSDYRFALGYWWRSRRLMGRSIRFAGCDVGRLVDADLSAGRFSYSVVQALLSYRFWTNIARYGIKISHVLDWYEGQDVDRAIAAAINWHGLPITHIGYRHVTPPHYLGVTPIQSEVDAGVVPRTLAVVGEWIRRELTGALTGVEVRSAPSFRFPRLRSFAPVFEQRTPTVLVLLPLDADAARQIGDLLHPIIEAASDRKWLIKYHPLMTEDEAKRVFGSVSPNMLFIRGDYYHWLARCDLVVGGATNALSEAVAVGVPAICLASGNRPTEIPIPVWAPARLWRMCYTSTELLGLVDELLLAHVDANELKVFQDELAGPWNLDAIRVALGLA